MTVFIVKKYSAIDGNGNFSFINIDFFPERGKLTTKPEYGEAIAINSCTLSYRELIDLYFEDGINEIEYMADGETEYYEYDYKSIAGDIIVTWEWEKYVGYCRNLKSIDYGIEGKTEKDLITGNEQRTFRSNHSILCKAKDLECLS